MISNPKVTANHDVKKVLFFIGFLILTIYVFWQINELGWLDMLKNQEKMAILIKNLGILGPVAIVFLIATAIIISPLPSAPVALVSGALYGHTFGTIYVVLGALSGALIAFMISRKLGYDYVNRKLHHRLPVNIVGSQNTLMLIVFFTRLAPFISFDVISYAAGLTKLTFGRFILATLMGIIPISFVLAHLGSEVENGEMKSIAIALLLLGFFTLIPLIIKKLMTNSSESN
jgi:uncharacterized membrane protein YdjX (TVP38/TMEM64 family)